MRDGAAQPRRGCKIRQARRRSITKPRPASAKAMVGKDAGSDTNLGEHADAAQRAMRVRMRRGRGAERHEYLA